MSNSFEGKRVLITGASKGLGMTAALAYVSEGAKLALVARSSEKLEDLKNSLANPNQHLVFNMDLLETSNIKKLSDDILEQWSGVDVILHCIGGSLGVNETLVDWDNFAKCLKGNIGIAAEINRYFVPNMKDQGKGCIIHVGSVNSIEARGSVPYNSSKAAVSGYVRSLGKELAEYGIVVTGIFPGAFYAEENAMFRYEYYKPEEYKEFVKTLPQQRMPLAEEYIPMLFLLSDHNSKIMGGSLITMDGAQGQAYYNFSL